MKISNSTELKVNNGIKIRNFNRPIAKENCHIRGEVFNFSKFRPLGSDIYFAKNKENPNDENVKLSSGLAKLLEFLGSETSGQIRNDLEQIATIASSDKLSGLPNKMALYSDLQKHVEQCKLEGKPLVVAMFDMDNFKSVNDFLGYETGDEFIKIISSKIKKSLGSNGYSVYRFGGEEFVALMPGAKKEEALPIVKSALEAVNADKKMDSYLGQYIRRGRRIMQGLEARQSLLKEVDADLAKLECVDDIFEAYENNTEYNSVGEVGNFITEVRVDAERKLKKSAYEILDKAQEEAINDTDKNLLQKYKSKLDSGMGAKELFRQNGELYSYLYTKYNNESKIALIRKWLARVSSPDENGKLRGFTISSGVNEFNDLDIPIENFIQEAGGTLSYAKRHMKGNVYYSCKDSCKIY